MFQVSKYWFWVDWKQCKHAWKKQNTIFQILKKCFFLQSPISFYKGLFHKKGTTKGICNFSSHPTIAVQKQSDFTSQRAHSISFPCNPRKKGSFAFISQGECEKKQFFRAWKNCIFCKAGFVLLVGLGTEKEELQHLISESHKASAKTKNRSRFFFSQCLAWPLQSLEKGSFYFIPQGECEKTIFQKRKIVFLQSPIAQLVARWFRVLSLQQLCFFSRARQQSSGNSREQVLWGKIASVKVGRVRCGWGGCGRVVGVGWTVSLQFLGFPNSCHCWA